jgi:hypothetical protein
VSKKRRARTRRQSQIRHQEQIRRESLGRRDDTRPSSVRADERRAQREVDMAPLAARDRALTRLLGLSIVCLLYALGLWVVQLLWRDTITSNHPGLWTGLLIGLAVAVALCWIPGLILTIRDRAWFYVIVIVVPFTTIPALMYYTFTRRQAVRQRMKGTSAGGGRPSRRPPDRRPAGRRPPAAKGRGAQSSSTDSIKLLNDR